MRYIAFVYNIFTLAHIISYADNCWGKDNTRIVFSDLATPIPQSIIDDYKIDYIPSENVLERRRIDGIVCACRLSRRIWNRIDCLISDTDEDITLVVFRDNEVEEATFIEKAIRKYKHRIHVWIMEEGNGIYANEKAQIRYLTIKKLFYMLYRVSLYPLMNRPQGLHSSVEKVICSNPEMIQKKLTRPVEIEKVNDVFTYNLNEYLIKTVCEGKSSAGEYKYVFLTQPFENYRDEHDALIENYKKILPQVLGILSEKGKVIIKLHPRETFDYIPYQTDNIRLSSEKEKMLPFQCLMQYYGYPQMISIFSSACVGLRVTYPSIYMFKIFGIPGIDKLFTDEFYKSNNIIACNNLDEFERLLT